MYKNIQKIIRMLENKKLTLSIVESCSGGMLAQSITSVSGASKVFKFGVITYSNKSKIKYLKVPLRVIKKYGAVSKQCCHSMVNNLSKISEAKLNIAITGIAGPKGGSKLKPVGLVYIGIKKGNKTKITKWFFEKKKRESIRVNSVKKSLELINEFI